MKMKLMKRIGAERDFDREHGERAICQACGLDFYDVKSAHWATNPDMSYDLDRGISGFALAHSNCKICERKEGD